jgi:hypothetical protein
MLFDAEGRLVVLSDPAPTPPGEGFLPPGGLPRPSGTLHVDTIDVSDPAAPRLVESRTLQGDLAAARRAGGAIRLVLQSDFVFPEGVVWGPVSPDFYGWPREVQIKWFEDQLARNQELIVAQTLAGWLGSPQVDCNAVHIATAEAPAGLTRVVTLAPAANGAPEPATAVETVLLAGTNQVYVGTEAVYLTSAYTWWNDAQVWKDHTFLHKLSLASPSATTYVASGGVDGHLLGSFAMDEHDGVLRVATTDSNGVTVNRVSTLGVDGRSLAVLGSTPDLAAGERIFGVRFYGDKGYVVTFRQTDPLFALDLSDPAAPRVTGELHLPGFSTYLQALDATHLVALGRAGDESGRVFGTKIALYDVADPTAPREVAQHVLSGDVGTEAESDHKAFTLFVEQGRLALPVTGGLYAHALVLFDVSPERGIQLTGQLDVSDLLLGSYESWGWWRRDGVMRSIFADDVVYAVTGQGVRAAKTANPGAPLATVRY